MAVCNRVMLASGNLVISASMPDIYPIEFKLASKRADEVPWKLTVCGTNFASPLHDVRLRYLAGTNNNTGNHAMHVQIVCKLHIQGDFNFFSSLHERPDH